MRNIDLRVLQYSFAELSAQDAVQKSKRTSLPSESTMLQFNMIAKDVINRMSGTLRSCNRNVQSFFGAPSTVIAKVWESTVNNNDSDVDVMSNEGLLLWALHHLKECLSLSVMCETMQKQGRNKATATLAHTRQCRSGCGFTPMRSWSWSTVSWCGSIERLMTEVMTAWCRLTE